jgi:hypothetical protein
VPLEKLTVTKISGRAFCLVHYQSLRLKFLHFDKLIGNHIDRLFAEGCEKGVGLQYMHHHLCMAVFVMGPDKLKE